MKRIITAAVLVLFIVSLMAGCSCASGDSSSKKPKTSSSKTEETLEVIETNPDGSTVERDSEGNTVTKDKDGNIKSVKDKNGRALNVGEYIKSHPFAQKPAYKTSSSGGSKASKSKPKKPTKSSKKTSSESKSNKTSSNGNSSKNSSKNDEAEEGKIPEAIATVPDVDDQETIDGF